MTFSLLPRTVLKTKSKISGEIVVKEQLGQYSLHVQGMIQSGGIIKGVWKKALKKISNSQFLISNILILGLGGGTVAKLIDKIPLKRKFVKIIGIEIDPEIIKIGKKFFGLDEIKNLKIIQADAFKTINNQPFDFAQGKQSSINNFDLIIVDLYLGSQFPKKAESDEFLENIKKLLSKNGLVIFNRLKTDEIENFGEKLRKHFQRVEKVATSTNFFFLSSTFEVSRPTPGVG